MTPIRRRSAFAAAEAALAWYDSERVNVVAATGQASACGLHDVAWRLPAPLFIIFNSRGNWADCIATHRIALDSARQAGNRQGEAWVLNNLGEALADHRRQRQASATWSRRWRSGARSVTGWARRRRRTTSPTPTCSWAGWTGGPRLLRRALDLNREVGYRYGEGVALTNLGEALLDLNRAEEAIDYLQQARRTFAEIDYLDGDGLRPVLSSGTCYLSLGRDAEALDCLRQAHWPATRPAGNRHRQAVTLKSLGQVQARGGLVAEARDSWARAAAIFDDLGDSAQAAEVRAEQAASGIS